MGWSIKGPFDQLLYFLGACHEKVGGEVRSKQEAKTGNRLRKISEGLHGAKKGLKFPEQYLVTYHIAIIRRIILHYTPTESPGLT